MAAARKKTTKGVEKKAAKGKAASGTAVTPKKKPRRPLKRWSHDKFVAAMHANHGTVSCACAAVGISRNTAYGHRAENPVFAMRWDLAVEEAHGKLEVSMMERATVGWLEPVIKLQPARNPDGKVALDGAGKVISEWKPVGSVRRHSDVLAIFCAKNRIGERYLEPVAIARALDKLGLTEEDADGPELTEFL